MVSIKSLALTSLLSASAFAENVACIVNGKTVAVVDHQTGVCPFTLPASLPAIFDYVSDSDYNVEFYYSVVAGKKYFTDIPAAGHEIDIPASLLFGAGAVPVFQVHVQQSSPSNSTNAIRRRLMKETLLPRDSTGDFVAGLELIDGTQIDSSYIEVAPLSDVTSSTIASTAAPTTTPPTTATATDVSTTIITITSCSDDKCHETTVPATYGPTTETVEGTETIYTTWCPVTGTETVTEASTTLVTITSCADDKCHETTVPATYGPTTETVEGTETIYTTWCPVTGTETVTEASTTLVTITSCADDKCYETAVPATYGPTTETVEGTETIYTTWCPVTATATATAATPATVAPASETIVVVESSNGEIVSYTTVVPIPSATAPGTAAPGTAAPGTAAPGTAAPGTDSTTTIETTEYKTVSSSTGAQTTGAPTTVAPTGAPSSSPAVTIPSTNNGAAVSKASILALVVIPLAYLI